VVEKRKKNEQGDGYMYSATDAGRRTRLDCGYDFASNTTSAGRRKLVQKGRKAASWPMTILGVLTVVISLCTEAWVQVGISTGVSIFILSFTHASVCRIGLIPWVVVSCGELDCVLFRIYYGFTQDMNGTAENWFAPCCNLSVCAL